METSIVASIFSTNFGDKFPNNEGWLPISSPKRNKKTFSTSGTIMERLVYRKFSSPNQCNSTKWDNAIEAVKTNKIVTREGLCVASEK